MRKEKIINFFFFFTDFYIFHESGVQNFPKIVLTIILKTLVNRTLII